MEVLPPVVKNVRSKMAAPMNENVLATFAKTFVENTNNIGNLLNLSTENGLFTTQKSGHYQEILSHAHSCLNSSPKRLEGLLIIQRIAKDCVTEIFTQNALSWLRFMMQIFQSHDADIVKSIAASTSADILKISSDFTSLSRDVTNIIPQLLSTLLDCNSKWKNEALACITCCMSNYSSSCGQLKSKIDAFIVKELNSDDPCEEAAVCFANLSQCGGSGKLGIKHTEGWTMQCCRVLSALHDVLDNMYEGLDVMSIKYPNHTENSIAGATLNELPTVCSTKYQILVSRFTNIAQCLQELLGLKCESVVKVPHHDILQLICRVLTINSKFLVERPSSERLSLAGFIPLLHTQTLEILKCLISSGRNNLLAQSKMICTLLVQELMWSRTKYDYGHEKTYAPLRIKVYEVLTLWLKMTGSFVETMKEEDLMVSEILNDIKPQIDLMKVTNTKISKSSVSEAPPSKKRKRGGYQDISHGISTQRKIDQSAGADLVHSALNALYWLIMTTGSVNKHKTRQSIHEVVVTNALNVFQDNRQLVIPYIDATCRLTLLRCLHACCIVSHPTSASPIHCALSILQCALQDKNLEVSSFCIEAQASLENYIHPRVPCIKPAMVIDDSDTIHISLNESDVLTENNNIKTGKEVSNTSVNKNQPATVQVSDTISSPLFENNSQESLFKSPQPRKSPLNQATKSFASVSTNAASSYFMSVSSNQVSFSDVSLHDEGKETQELSTNQDMNTSDISAEENSNNLSDSTPYGLEKQRETNLDQQNDLDKLDENTSVKGDFEEEDTLKTIIATEDVAENSKVLEGEEKEELDNMLSSFMDAEPDGI